MAAAALVLAAETSSARWSTARPFALRPLQWAGDNSYSIYMWHWPLVVSPPWALHRALFPAAKVAVPAATLALAALTKRFIEDPVRSGRRWVSRR